MRGAAPQLGLGSLNPKVPFPCPRNEAWSPGAGRPGCLPDPRPPCACPACSRPCGRPCGQGCWWPPAPGPLPAESPCQLARAVPVPGPGRPGGSHLACGQQHWERGQAGSGKSGWWAQGEGYKWPPPGRAPAQKGHGALLRPMGAQGPPHLPGRPGPAQPRAAVQSKKSLGGGVGAEVGWLYLGTGDEFKKTSASHKEPEASGHGLAGPWWGTRLRGRPRGPGEPGPPGPVSGPTPRCPRGDPQRLSAAHGPPSAWQAPQPLPPPPTAGWGLPRGWGSPGRGLPSPGRDPASPPRNRGGGHPAQGPLQLPTRPSAQLGGATRPEPSLTRGARGPGRPQHCPSHPAGARVPRPGPRPAQASGGP